MGESALSNIHQSRKPSPLIRYHQMQCSPENNLVFPEQVNGKPKHISSSLLDSDGERSQHSYEPIKHASQPKYGEYKDYKQTLYTPKKNLSKHIGLDIKDIPGAQPKNYGNLKGKKILNFWPHDKAINDFYNKEATGINAKSGQYEVAVAPYLTRQIEPHRKHHVRRHYPTVNPPLSDAFQPPNNVPNQEFIPNNFHYNQPEEHYAKMPERHDHSGFQLSPHSPFQKQANAIIDSKNRMLNKLRREQPTFSNPSKEHRSLPIRPENYAIAAHNQTNINQTYLKNQSSVGSYIQFFERSPKQHVETDNQQYGQGTRQLSGSLEHLNKDRVNEREIRQIGRRHGIGYSNFKHKITYLM